MGIFGKIKSAVAGIFKQRTAPKMKVSGRRGEEEAATHTQGQTARRRKLLEQRVETGESQRVYKNKKPIDVLSTGVGPSLESVTVDSFLDGHFFSRFSSSNVWALQYDRTHNSLFIQYMAGSGRKKHGPGIWFQYLNVSLAEAKLIYNAASKGVFIWQNIRVKGSQTAHKKPFIKGASPPPYLPLGQKKRSNVLQSP